MIPRISDLNAAEHGPDHALAAIRDPQKTLAIHAETARYDVSLALLVEDHALEMSHDRFAVLDREADLAGRRALQILVDRQFRTMGRPELARALRNYSSLHRRFPQSERLISRNPLTARRHPS